jgi:hypothetical protein
VREIKPYQTLRGAQRALDNGWRFYNLFARSGEFVLQEMQGDVEYNVLPNEPYAYPFTAKKTKRFH